MHVLILCGGGGTRLWPLSRQDYPKQFLRIGGSNSLLQRTVERFRDSPLTETLTISTNAQYEYLIRQQLKTDVKLIIEPAKRNTAPAIAFALKQMQLPPDASILVVPSDHLIDPQDVLIQSLQQVEFLLKDRFILFGIRPSKPETGYGYIQSGAHHRANTFHVKRFVEKPPLTQAEQYIASGDYYWNSGMFGCSLSLFWEKLARHAPEIAENERFEEMPDISFDYAVLEKMEDLLVCPLSVRWSDVGSWDSVYDTMDKDANQNVKQGNICSLNTKNSLIIGGKRLISTIGLEDLLIVETEDATFISKRGESQKVKEMVQELLKTGKKEGANHALQRFPWGTIQPMGQVGGYSIEKISIDPQQSWPLTAPGQWVSFDPFQASQGATGDLIPNPDLGILELLFLKKET